MTDVLRGLDDPLILGERQLFERTLPYIATAGDMGALALIYSVDILPRKLTEDMDRTLGVHTAPVFADLLSKGIVSPLDPDMQQVFANTRDREIVAFRRNRETPKEPKKTQDLVDLMAMATYLGVIVRPKGVVVPAVDRKLHTSDFQGSADSPVHELLRHRINFLKELETHAVVGTKSAKKIAQFIGDGSTDAIMGNIAGFLVSKEARDRQLLGVMSALFIAGIARHMLPLLTCNPDQAEVLRKRFIERGFDEIYKQPDKIHYGELLFGIGEILPKVQDHVLRGDNRGGGHHIPSLDSNFVQICGPIDYIHAGVSGSDAVIPVAWTKKYNAKGEQIFNDVESFFPTDWSAEEVMRAIKSPHRLVYGQDRQDGLTVDYVQYKGVLIQRIYMTYEDDASATSLVTAFPATPILPSVRAGLKPSSTL